MCLKRSVLLVFCVLSFAVKAQVGINTTTPLSTLDINGNLSLKTIGIPTPLYGGPAMAATPINDGTYISLTPTTGNTQFYLPNAVTVPGRIYILRNISNTVNATLYAAAPSQFFAKDSNTATPQPVTLPANAALKTLIVISDGANWTYIF
jgi:hypothetical protein